MKIWPTNGGCLWQFPQKRLNFWGGKSLQPWVYDQPFQICRNWGAWVPRRSFHIWKINEHHPVLMSWPWNSQFFNAVVNPRSASYGGFLKSGYPQSSSIWKIGIFPDFPSISIGLSPYQPAILGIPPWLWNPPSDVQVQLSPRWWDHKPPLPFELQLQSRSKAVVFRGNGGFWKGKAWRFQRVCEVENGWTWWISRWVVWWFTN